MENTQRVAALEIGQATVAHLSVEEVQALEVFAVLEICQPCVRHWCEAEINARQVLTAFEARQASVSDFPLPVEIESSEQKLGTRKCGRIFDFVVLPIDPHASAHGQHILGGCAVG